MTYPLVGNDNTQPANTENEKPLPPFLKTWRDQMVLEGTHSQNLKLHSRKQYQAIAVCFLIIISTILYSMAG